MTQQCPDHPGRLDAQLGDCTHCRAEASRADHATHLAAVRAALAQAPKPPTPKEQP